MRQVSPMKSTCPDVSVGRIGLDEFWGSIANFDSYTERRLLPKIMQVQWITHDVYTIMEIEAEGATNPVFG